MSVLLEFAMFPTSDECRKGSSVSHQVAKIIDMIDQSGLSYQLTPMGTIVECASVPEALSVVERAYEQLLDECERVYSTIKLDIRKGEMGRLNGKIASVESKLGRTVKS
jgi:uncharacterized protein (TIGR00106 family)